ncbi:protein regulator of cytokinesis 1-like [Schistosoma japonicum]|nr:protein regulator of cytokinesis 1-like [Schistosoma japonicum]
MCASLSVSNILKCVEKKCLSILSVWNEIGVEGSELDEKMDSVINQIEVLLERILADQRAKKMQLSQSIEELITSISEISLELNNTPFDPPKTATLLELYNFLLTKKDKLLKDAKDYIQKFSLLKDLEKKLCSRLCEAEITLVYKVIPSQEQMTLLSRRVEHLNLLKAERITKFLELRSQMIAGYEKLGKPLRLVSDSCCLVKDILAPEALETFTLSEENMFSMADIVDQLASDCARLDTECNVYRDRLNLLVNLLNPLGITCDIIEYENSNLTLLKLRTEVDRLEGLRTRHLDTLISTAQSQVYQCWDDCFVGEEHRQKFKFFIQNKDSKDVLSILEKEIITWKDFKKSNSEFIIDIIKWCEQFSSLQSLKKPELIKSKIDSRRRSRSVPPGGQKVIFPKVVMQQDKPTTSKNVLDDMNLYAKSSLTKQSVSEVDSFFEGLKGSSKVPHVSTFIQ